LGKVTRAHEETELRVAGGSLRWRVAGTGYRVQVRVRTWDQNPATCHPGLPPATWECISRSFWAIIPWTRNKEPRTSPGLLPLPSSFIIYPASILMMW